MSDTYLPLIDEIDQFVCPKAPSATPSPMRSALAILLDANAALRVLANPGLNDFSRYQHAQTETRLARAESNAASVTVELRLMRERCAELMSQSEPLAGLGVDRELVRQVLHYVQCGRLK